MVKRNLPITGMSKPGRVLSGLNIAAHRGEPQASFLPYGT